MSSFLRRGVRCHRLYDAKYIGKKFLSFARGANQCLHVIQVALQGFPAGCGEPIFRFGQPAVKRLGTQNVIGFLELPGMHAQVAIGGLQQGLELVEGQRTIHGESTDDAQADALVD